MSNILSRIRRVKLDSFRGWGSDEGRPREVNTDADIVLIQGANGTGKTSFIQALIYVLTTVDVQRLKYPRRRERDSEEPAALVHRDHNGRASKGWRIEAEGNDGLNVSLSWTEDSPDLQWQGSYRESATQRLDGLDPKVHARAIAVLQEFLEQQFTGGLKLLESFIRPVAREIEWVRHETHSLSKAFAKRADESVNRRRLLSHEEKVQMDKIVDVVLAIMDVTLNHSGLTEQTQRDLAGVMERTWSSIGPTWDPDDVAQDWIAVVLGALGASANASRPSGRQARGREAWEELKRLLERLLTREPDELLKLHARVDELEFEHEQAMTSMATRPKLRFGPTNRQLSEILFGLRDACEKFEAHRAGEHGIFSVPKFDEADGSSVSSDLEKDLHFIENELLRVNLQRLEDIAWRAERVERPGSGRSPEDVQVDLSRARKELEAFLDSSRVGQILDRIDELAEAAYALEDAQTKLSTLDDPEAMRQCAAQAEWLSAAIKEPHPEVRAQCLKYFHSVLDNTMFRFQPRERLLPVRWIEDAEDSHRELMEDSHRELMMGDELRWTEASTGQKAIIALASAVGHALLFRSRLPAHILLFDDTSTSFDLGNLVRQASWFRQLAYTDNPDQRYQIFIASHHDELTSRLVDLLKPPPGRTLRVIEFESYRPGYGPELVEWEMGSPFGDGDSSQQASDAGDATDGDRSAGRVSPHIMAMAKALGDKLEGVWNVLDHEEFA